MNRRLTVFVVRVLVVVVLSLQYFPAAAANLTIPTAGRVTIELITSDASFRNTLSVISPTVGIAATGCQLEPAVGLTGLHVLTEKSSQHGCRVDLDADTATAGIQGFAANTAFEFGMCAQTDADPDCEFVWSSNPSNNSDSFDHVQTTTLAPGVFQLAWEDLQNGGDMDFNDLIVVVRVQADADGDGLWDDWESSGIDTDGDGTRDFDLPALGANPNRKDIFLEIDFMDCTTAGGDCAAGDTHSHEPNITNVIDPVIQAFANAPVSNPNGTTGITLHVDVSNSIPHQNFLNIPGLCKPAGAGIGNFDTVKADSANFGPNNPRRFVYHYALFTHLQTNDTSDPNQTSSGCGELPGNDFQVSMGGFTGSVGTALQQAGTLMHEFGHTLNLRHGGGDNINRKPNYISIMNYAFQLPGIPPTARIDFSSVDLADLTENNLNETIGIGDGTDNTRFFCPNGTQGTGAGTGAINWNCDINNGTDTSVSVDVNGDGTIGTLTGFDDWDNLRYTFQNTGSFADGVHEKTIDFIEMDYPTYLQIPQSVVIDIKPGRFPNRIDLEKKVCKDDDNLHVAILTTPGFDALTVDASTLQLGDPNLSGTATIIRSRVRDIDLDGEMDMALVFPLCKLVTDAALNENTIELVLTGKTLDGSNIMGRDSVKVVRDN